MITKEASRFAWSSLWRRISRRAPAAMLLGCSLVGLGHIWHWHFNLLERRPGGVWMAGKSGAPGSFPLTMRGRYGVEAKKKELAARRAALARKESALSTLRKGAALPVERALLESIPGLAKVLLEQRMHHSKSAEDPCHWVERAGVDAFRGRCDLAAFESDPPDCAKACDETKNGRCRAWTRVGNRCFLKWCDSAGAEAKIRDATSAVRANRTACAERRGWTISDYEPEWLTLWRAHYGVAQTFLSHHRKPTDGHTFGPIATIRGERHSGTNWVRAMLEANCPSLGHRLSASLDSDGAYGWKHGPSPRNWSPDSKDAMIVLVRSAASWVPKMKRVAYNPDLDRYRKDSLAHYMLRSFVDNYSKARFKSVVELRSSKYRDYGNLASRCKTNVFAVRYEDLVQSGATFLFKALARHISACLRATFQPVEKYTKFGAMNTGRPYVENIPVWTRSEWATLLALLDLNLEASLGYVYKSNSPGDCDVLRPPNSTWLLVPPANFDSSA